MIKMDKNKEVQIMKKGKMGQVVVLVILLINILIVVLGKGEIVSTAIEIMGKQQNYNMEAEEPITMGIEQCIEKYLELEDNQVLLQQKIEISTNHQEKQREKERLQVKVPNLQGKEPERIAILADGKLLEKSHYQYDNENKEIKIETTNKIDTYKIIYTYLEQTAIEAEVQLITKANVKFEKTEEIESQDEKTMIISPVGEKISIQGEMTKEVYKGYLYEARENETEYEESYKIEVSSTQNLEGMNLIKEKEVYTYWIGEEKIERHTNQSTYYKQTIINKEEYLRILGEEGRIILQNAQDELIQEITKETQEDENGNIVICYQDKEIKDLKIMMTNPVSLGEIKVYNQKAIKSQIGYEKQEIEKIECLESNIRLNESVTNMEMKLQETKSEIKVSMDKNDLSALQKNENVQILVTLQSNSNEYDLYKNPKIEMVFPEELKIDIKNITQLNLEEELIIKEAGIKEEENRKMVRIALEGEQKNYSKNLNQGIQIAIIADIQMDPTTSPRESKIEVSCINENKQGESKVECPFKIHSKYGVLMINEIQNYNQTQDTIKTIDDEEANIELEIKKEERIGSKTTTIMNYYENPISGVSIVGTIIDEEESSKIDFNDIIIPENKEAKIYYSDQILSNDNSEYWKETKEEIESIKSYKIVIKDEIQPGERVTLKSLFHIAENLEGGMTGNLQNTLEYDYLENTETTVSNVRLTTRKGQEEIFVASKEGEALDGVKLEISAMSGNQSLKDGDVVKEGQGIRYQLRVTNQTDRTLSNIVLEATNTNAIYYDLIEYQESVDFINFTKYKIEENEALTSKILKIDSLAIGETKEVSYQISVKEGVEDPTLTGEIRITAENQEEKVISNIRNKIEKAKIKATTKFLYSETVPIYEKVDIPFDAQVKNISNQELKDILVEVPIAKGLEVATPEELRNE